MADERFLTHEEVQRHIDQFAEENREILRFPPQQVILGQAELGDIRLIRGEISGGSKTIYIPQLAITLRHPEGKIISIPVLAAKGRAVATAKLQRKDEFELEVHPYSKLDDGLNVVTRRVGRPKSIPQHEKAPEQNNGYFSTESAAGSISLQQILRTLTSPETDMIDKEIGWHAENLLLFKQAMLFKFLAGAFSSLEELHMTSIPTRNTAERLTVCVHGDVNWHAGNTVHSIVPGRGTFGNSVLLDLARVQETTIINQTYDDITDVYASNPGSALVQEHKQFENVIRGILAKWQHPDLFPPAIDNQQIWTGGLFEKMYKDRLQQLQIKLGRQQQDFSTVFEPSMQDSFFTAHVGTLIRDTQRQNGIVPYYQMEHAKEFARRIKIEIIGDIDTLEMQAFQPRRGQ